MWGANTEGAASARPARLLRSRRLLLEAPAAFQDCARRVVHHLRGRSRLALSPTTSSPLPQTSAQTLPQLPSNVCTLQSTNFSTLQSGGRYYSEPPSAVSILCVTGAETTVSGAVLEQFSELPHSWSAIHGILYMLTRRKHITVSTGAALWTHASP